MADYLWDADKRRYIDPKGKIITPIQQRKIGQRIITESTEAMTNLATRYTEGAASLAEFATGMREAVKGTHSAMTQFAYGGKLQMTPRELGRLGKTIQEQNKFLNGFIQDIENKSLSDLGIINRSGMYGEAGWSTYESAIGDREEEAGAKEERSFLDPDADHCQECFDEASEGWVEIGTLVPIGDRECLTRCMCSFEYR